VSKGVNKAIIVGNVGQDPDTKYTQDGKPIANLSIATSESWKDKQGQRQERTEWHRVVFYGKLAEIVDSYVKKGTKLYIEGSIHTRKWQDKDGQDRYTTEIKGREMQMLDSRDSSPAPQQAPQQAPQSVPPSVDSFDDDIPFAGIRGIYGSADVYSF